MSDTPRTVKVRVAVAVDHTGYWSAVGWNGCDDPMKYNLDHVEEGERHYYLTATLEVPEAAEVEADVEVGPDLCFVCLTELVDGECPKCREAA